MIPIFSIEHAREMLAASLHDAGFEVLGAVAVSAYNASLEERLHGFRLPHLLADESGGVAFVIGNTRRLWDLFLAEHASTALGEEPHPLDQYSRMHIGRALEQLTAGGVVGEARFSFDPPPHTVAIQRLATLAGVAELAPIGLCIHPQYGPWFSLRAAIVLALPGPDASAAQPTCSACTGKPCLMPRDAVMALGGSSSTREQISTHWQTWLAMRDACPIGRDARYTDPQVRYHYLKDKQLLRVANREPGSRLTKLGHPS